MLPVVLTYMPSLPLAILLRSASTSFLKTAQDAAGVDLGVEVEWWDDTEWWEVDLVVGLCVGLDVGVCFDLGFGLIGLGRGLFLTGRGRDAPKPPPLPLWTSSL